jgi:transposase
VQLEIRPVYHKNDERIRGHVFLCMLAYYTAYRHKLRVPHVDSDKTSSTFCI